MRYWKECLSNKIIDGQYESLVGDFSGTVEYVVQHCYLEPGEQCFRFDQNAAPFTTASAVQVREPIYDGSIGMFRNSGPGVGFVVQAFEHIERIRWVSA